MTKRASHLLLSSLVLAIVVPLSRGVVVNDLDENSVHDTSVQCSYRLFRGEKEVGSAEAGALQVHLGDRLEHRWECVNLAPLEFLFVHDCVASPKFDQERDRVILDSRGCPVDDFIMGKVRYSADGRVASSEHSAYRFTDDPNVLFKCSISVCRSDAAGCPSSLPVNCSKTYNPRFSKTVDRNSSDIVLSVHF
uniref:ZP domain-containing protein n=1 Tax=Steinernema glaseri TaxID=37863 RepID=A0A1I8A139_9BILA